MPAFRLERDSEFDSRTWLAHDERLRLGAGRPTWPARLRLEARQRGRIVRAPVGGNLGHAGVFDAEFFAQEGNLGPRLLELCRQTGACVKASGGPRPRVDTGESRQGDDVEQGGFDVAVPVIGEKQVRTTVVLGQISLRKKLWAGALEATISVVKGTVYVARRRARKSVDQHRVHDRRCVLLMSPREIR